MSKNLAAVAALTTALGAAAPEAEAIPVTALVTGTANGQNVALSFAWDTDAPVTSFPGLGLVGMESSSIQTPNYSGSSTGNGSYSQNEAGGQQSIQLQSSVLVPQNAGAPAFLSYSFNMAGSNLFDDPAEMLDLAGLNAAASSATSYSGDITTIAGSRFSFNSLQDLCIVFEGATTPVDPTPVPEPATGALLVAAALAAAVTRRRSAEPAPVAA